MTSSSRRTPRPHIPALDGLRGIAILLVMLYHFTGGTDEAASGADRWFSRLTGFGWCGVDLFFVLSGFLITGILYDNRDSRTYLRDFYARRALRIFPLYYGVLLVLFILLPGVLGVAVSGMDQVGPNQSWLWLYCSNIASFLNPDLAFHAGSVQTKHFWSLAIEEQFYFVWPLLVLMLGRAALLRVCVWVAACSMLLRIGLTLGHAGDVYTFTPCRLEGLMVGAFLALVVGPGSSVATLAPWAKRAAIVCAAPLVATWLLVGLDNAHWTMQTWGFTLLAVFFGALLVLSLASPQTSRWSRVLSSRGLRFFGKYSYGLYVFHYLLSPVFSRYFSASVLTRDVFGHYWPARLASVALSFLVSIAVAWLSWHLFEKHFLRLKDRFAPGAHASARPMRVVVASSGLGHVSRGIEAWASDLGRALAERGVDVILCKGAGRAGAPFERVVPCWTRDSLATRRVVRLLPRRLGWRLGLGSGYGVEQATFAFRLLPLLRREHIDILHVQDPLVATIVQWARRWRLVPTRTILAHGTEERADYLTRFEHVQHLAPWHDQECRAQGASNSGWTTIPNFVDTNRFLPGDQSAMRRELGIPDDSIVVLTAAAIKRTHKRIDALLDEFASVLRADPSLPIWLVIAGGQERDTDGLIEQGRALLGDRVRFLVRFPRGRMPDLYRCADVFVLASLKEMMPIAVLEALASGLPCVVNAHPVLEWMVGPGGVPIDMGRVGALATSLHSLAKDPARRHDLGQRARRHCENQFGEAPVVEKIQSFYRAILANENSPVPQTTPAAPTSISVVIPTFNGARWIEEAVDSVLAQTLAPTEIIIIDDGSTDDTRSRLAKYGNRVRYVHQENQGVSAARNLGIARSKGEWIAFLDADDVWHPEKLERQAQAIANEPGLALLGTSVIDWPGSFGDIPPEATVARQAWPRLAVKNRFTTSSVIVRRDVLGRVGAFDVELRGPEDYDLWLRVAESAPVGVLETALVGYRDVPGSLGRRARSMEAGLGRVLAKIAERRAWRGRWLLRRKSCSYWRYSCAYMYSVAGEHRKALARILQSIVLYPLPYRRDEVRLPLARLRMLSMMIRRWLGSAHAVPASGVVKSA